MARIRAFSALMVLGVFLASCGNNGGSGGIKTGPGVDSATKTISLGILAPLSLSNPASTLGIPLTKGIETYFQSVNANGGINGWKIKLVEKDNNYSPQTQVEVYNEIHNQVLMLAESFGTPTTFAIKDLTNHDQMLTSVASLDSYLARQKYMVLIGTPYRLQVENGFDYVVNKLGATNPKTGFIYQDDQYGQDGLTGYKEAIGCYHLNDVGQASFELTDTQFTAQVSKMKNAGAQYVFLTGLPQQAATIIGTAHALGYDPHWIWQSPAYATALLQTPVAPLLEHEVMLMGQGATWGDTSVPGMAQLLQDVQKYAPSQKPDGYFEFGYTEAKVTGAILTKAIANNDLSRAGLLTAFNSLTNVDVGGLYPTLHYGSSPNQRVPSRDNQVYAIDPTQPTTVKALGPDFTGTCASQSQF